MIIARPGEGGKEGGGKGGREGEKGELKEAKVPLEDGWGQTSGRNEALGDKMPVERAEGGRKEGGGREGGREGWEERGIRE